MRVPLPTCHGLCGASPKSPTDWAARRAGGPHGGGGSAWCYDNASHRAHGRHRPGPPPSPRSSTHRAIEIPHVGGVRGGRAQAAVIHAEPCGAGKKGGGRARATTGGAVTRGPRGRVDSTTDRETGGRGSGATAATRTPTPTGPPRCTPPPPWPLPLPPAVAVAVAVALRLTWARPPTTHDSIENIRLLQMHRGFMPLRKGPGCTL